MLLYNINGTVSEIVVTGIFDGKVTSSLATAPTILDSQLASASNAIIVNATNLGSSSAAAYGLGYKTNTNPTNQGTTYLSSTTSTKTYSANSYSVLNPTNADRSEGTNYGITGSTIIPAGAAFFVTSSYGLGPANTSAKVSITSSYFTPLFNSNINDSNDVKGYSILGYNGVISNIGGYNEFSSSTFNNYTQSFVVMYVSASKADMGSVVTSPLVVSLGTLQNRS